MSTEATEMVTIPRVDWEALQAELRRLRLIEAQAEALRRIKAYKGPQADDHVFTTREELAQALGLRA